MSAKVTLMFCAQAILIQMALSQCTSRTAPSAAPKIAAPYSAPIAASTLPASFGESSCLLGYPVLSSSAIEVTPTSGGLLPVTSASAFSPELKLASENEYEGTLSVAGELPFIGTVGLEGKVPSAGMGTVNHACGNGPARITKTNFQPFINSASIPKAYYSGFKCRDVIEYSRSSKFGYFGINENAYGGRGEGNVAAAGQLPVGGEAAIAGQVPIMGTVNYFGAVPASGGVSISGLCNCNGKIYSIQ